MPIVFTGNKLGPGTILANGMLGLTANSPTGQKPPCMSGQPSVWNEDGDMVDRQGNKAT